ncbi:NAD-dependent epimerase/dehydratase family protein [Pseudomonas sp. Irchel 3H3]|uniref:NAD-dependent epimerase/dehydratase family protein n=1 Tax=Pseudomonas sp. Irchel 3H3 TaxID=2009038 RepID=UPI000BA3174F|nr:NAD-dependent epimerase/dehydratase family protein [Pseudomonas sp. Irchel 3H3]
MSSLIENLEVSLRNTKQKWLITGVAGFIGSNLLEYLLSADQDVVGLDNFATGQQSNLQEVKSKLVKRQWDRFEFIEGDIRNLEDCRKSLIGVDHVLHHAALGSIPRSLKDPLETNEVNISGFLNMLLSSRNIGLKSFVYASSSSVYGNVESAQMHEEQTGKQLSPYAVTKRANELYADVFSSFCDYKIIGLRYFNVFGPRQNAVSEYSAVIPRWIESMLRNKPVVINGGGDTSRDFCFVGNVVQANILASLANEKITSNIFNVALNSQTSLSELYCLIKSQLEILGLQYELTPVKAPYRDGDIRHSLADIDRIKEELRYEPRTTVATGLRETVNWYVEHYQKSKLRECN